MKTNLGFIFLIIYLAFNGSLNCQAQCVANIPTINATFLAMKPGASQNITAAVSPSAIAFKWSSSCSWVNINNSTSQNCSISLNNNITCCNFALTLNYTVQSGSGSSAIFCSNYDVITIDVLPNLFAKELNSSNTATVVYPCETFSLFARHKNNSSCQYLCAPGAYIWTTTWGGNFTSITSATTNLSFGSSAIPNNVSINCTFYNCILSPQYIDHNTYFLDQLNLPVKLRNPNIIGDASIGCSVSPGPGGSTYSVTSVCGASYWNWTFDPTKFVAIGNIHSNSIVLNAIDTTISTTITAQALIASGSSVKSDIVAKVVNICCVSVKTYSDLVSISNYTREADVQIYTTNTVLAAAGATMHANDEVRLNPGFEIYSGAQVHLYNLGCTSTFSRPKNDLMNDSSFILQVNNPSSVNDLEENSNPTTVLNGKLENQIDMSFENKNILDNKISAEEIKLFPNPNNGFFTVYISKSNFDPYSIVIFNSLGEKMLSKNEINEKSINFDLIQYPNGLYTVHLNFGSFKIVKKLISQND